MLWDAWIRWTSLETTLHMKPYIFAHNMSCQETDKGDWMRGWNFTHQPICIIQPSTLPVLPFLPPVLLPALLPTSPPSLPDKNRSASSCQNHWPFTNFLFKISVRVCASSVKLAFGWSKWINWNRPLLLPPVSQLFAASLPNKCQQLTCAWQQG